MNFPLGGGGEVWDEKPHSHNSQSGHTMRGGQRIIAVLCNKISATNRHAIY